MQMALFTTAALSLGKFGTALWALVSSDGRKASASRSLPLPATSGYLLWAQLARATWREFCNLYPRMAMLRKIYATGNGICLERRGEAHEPQCPLYRIRLRARSEGIRLLQSIHPGATPADVYLLVNSMPLDLLLEVPYRGGSLSLCNCGSPTMGTRTNSQPVQMST
jgi:hypothetical protein